jgi:cytochrome P450
MARWANGEAHTRARDIAVVAVAGLDVDGLRAGARSAAAVELSSAVDLVPVARLVPVMVLAEALGFDAPRGAAGHQQVVTRAIAREDDTAPPEVDDVERSLAWLLQASGGATFEEAANRVALLHQCLDATAALIALAALRSLQWPTESAAALVAGVLCDEPPVISTVRIDGEGAAQMVPLVGRPFGAGAHRCPGEAVAVALAEGVFEALLASGRRALSAEVDLERRANLRMPRSIPLTSAD